MLHTSSQKLSEKFKEGSRVLSVSKQTYLRHTTRIADMLQQLSADWNWVTQAWTPQTTVLACAGAKPIAYWQVLNLETLWQVCWHKSAHSTFQTQRGAKVHQPWDHTLLIQKRAMHLNFKCTRGLHRWLNYWWLQVQFMVWYQRQLASVLGHQLWPLMGQGEETTIHTSREPWHHLQHSGM